MVVPDPKGKRKRDVHLDGVHTNTPPKDTGDRLHMKREKRVHGRCSLPQVAKNNTQNKKGARQHDVNQSRGSSRYVVRANGLTETDLTREEKKKNRQGEKGRPEMNTSPHLPPSKKTL